MKTTLRLTSRQLTFLRELSYHTTIVPRINMLAKDMGITPRAARATCEQLQKHFAGENLFSVNEYRAGEKPSGNWQVIVNDFTRLNRLLGIEPVPSAKTNPLPEKETLCFHCDNPALKWSDLCQTHHEQDCLIRRDIVCCDACQANLHDLCEGCQCQSGECDPWEDNARRTYDAQMQAEYEKEERTGRGHGI